MLCNMSLQRTGQFGTPWLVNLLLKKKTQEEEEHESSAQTKHIVTMYCICIVIVELFL